uniref:Uncharacterized protein n=1 Tax=Anopheles maculatus TaxID=74869 RepID=A0A182SXN2_9DIPT
MMHQPSRVLHQSSVPLRSMSQPTSHHSRSATVVPTANQTTNPYPSKGSQQYTKFRNNRSASSSRVLGGLQAPIKVEPKVDCRRKSGEVRLCKNGNEDESFATDRIPKMKLLKVNYVNLTNDETVKKPGSEIDKKESNTAATTIPGNHGKVLKEDVAKKKITSTAIVVGSSVKSTGNGCGSKVVNNNTGSNVADHQQSAGGPYVGQADNKECKKSAPSKETEAQNGDPGKGSNSKYLVYKKHNGFGANASHATESSAAGGKLQYINDSDIKIKALAKKKYGLLFENKKKSKLETVQYYFDSRGYERYVDNKLYGVINEKNKQQDVHAVQSTGSAAAVQTKLTDAQQKRQSWDAVRQHNRPSMMRVINQSPAAKKCANVIMMNHQTSAAAVAKPLSAEAPERLGAGDLKQENCRMFKLQKSHTSTNLLTRHKSMNDIHRINQLFLESRDRDPEPPLSSVAFASRQHLKHGNTSGDLIAPNAGPTIRADIAPVHRFEKHRKSEQGKYLVHKRLSARYKTESNLPNSLDVMRPAATDNATISSCTLSGDDTISKRIRKIIDDHQDHCASTETIDQQQDEHDAVHEMDKQKQQSHHASAHRSSNENISSKKFRRLSKSKSADKLIIESKQHTRDVHAKKEKIGITSTTCGYKNCKFSNCPMSSSSSSSSASSTSSTVSCSTRTNLTECSEKTVSTTVERIIPDQLDIVSCGKRTSIVINDNDDQMAEYKTDSFVINNLLLNNGMLSGKLNNTASSKDVSDEAQIVISSKIKEIDLESNRMIIEKCLAHPGPNVEIVSRQNSSWGVASSESDKDDGYYDQSERSISPDKEQPFSIVSTSSTNSSSSSTVCSESTNISSVTCTKSLPATGGGPGGNRYTSKTSIRLGCDGSLFLNKSYRDDTEVGSPCAAGSSDLEGDEGEIGGSDAQGCISGKGGSCCCCRRRNHQKLAHHSPPCLISSIAITSNGSSEKSVSNNNVGKSVHAHKHKSEHCACIKQTNGQQKIENFSPRPRSIEGPLDSGISISSDTAITSSDSDLNLQSQT